jgi:hypothetical protein
MSPKKAPIVAPLSKKAVLVSVNISAWTARKIDKKVTKETNSRHEAADDAGRYNKLLIEAKHMAKIGSLVSQARVLHHTMTLPWADEGPRILANVLFNDFSTKFRVLKRDFEREADVFGRNFQTYIDERKRKLGAMFNASDYPTVKEIRAKFKMDITVLPLPDAGDFRVDLDDDTLDELRSELQKHTVEVVDHAKEATARQIIEVVGHMSEKLAEYKKPTKNGKRAFFLDSLVENVRDLAKLLPAFNLADDPKMDAITKRIIKELCVEDAPTLRAKDDVRIAVKKSADDIVKAVSGLLG